MVDDGRVGGVRGGGGGKRGGRIVALVKCIDHPWHSFSKLKRSTEVAKSSLTGCCPEATKLC